MAEQEVRITKQDLADIVAAAVRAAKEPTVIEQRKIDAEQKEIEQAQDDRKKLAASILEDKENKKAMQRICSHEHKNGDSHCVYIMERTGPGYILCQKNQCKIRPGNQPANFKGDDIYDTALFNRIFQKLPGNELFQ